MPAPLNNLPGGVPVYLAVAPSLQYGPIQGGTLDLIDSDGECFAVQQIGTFEEGHVWTGRVEQSADATAWAAVPGAAFAPVTEGDNVQVLRFARTARYVRFASSVDGPNPFVALAVVIGQPRKSY